MSETGTELSTLGIAGLAGAIAMGLLGTIIYSVFANLAVMQESQRESIATEMLWALILLAPIVYTILVMRTVAASSPPGNAGRVLDMSLFIATFQSMPQELVSLSAIVTVGLGVAISLSWIGRVFLISAKS